jgi:PII-like signaling protein
MKTHSHGKLVTIYVTSTDHVHGNAVYQEIVKACQDLGIAGVTVTRCLEGYGLHRHLHTPRLLELSEDLPVRLEIIDTEEQIRIFLVKLDGLLAEGLVTVQDVQVYQYRPAT